MGVSSSDRSYCENVACVPGSVFSITQRFAQRGLRDELLAVRALTTQIRAVPFRVSDPGLALQNLDWWRQELTPRSASNSQHPVLRALVQTGALERLDPAVLNDYISAVAELAGSEAIPDVDALQGLAWRIGGAEASMEAGPDRASADHDALAQIGAAAFLNRLLHNIGALICGEIWWLPLDLRAKYRLTLADLRPVANDAGDDAGGDARLIPVVRKLCALALDMLNNGRQTLRRAQRSSTQPGRLHHLLIGAAVVEKRLRKLRSRPSRHAHLGVTAGEVLAAWRQSIRK